VLECVINISEGRRADVIAAVSAAAGRALLDVHSDPHHHRSVLTIAGPQVEDAARAVASKGMELIDLRDHEGVHPRIGAVDVVPFAPLTGSTMADAVAARDRFASWAGDELNVPVFLYGPERTLPEVRRLADALPPSRSGAVAVGARPLLVAYNVWLAPGVGIDVARSVAAAVRGPAVRALGLDVGGRAQVSCNLIDPELVGPSALFDAVASRAAVDGAELVGLVPASVLARVPEPRWSALDLARSRTIEARLQEAGLDGGSEGERSRV
jgi:glutamate formiminotransferase